MENLYRIFRTNLFIVKIFFYRYISLNTYVFFIFSGNYFQKYIQGDKNLKSFSILIKNV